MIYTALGTVFLMVLVLANQIGRVRRRFRDETQSAVERLAAEVFAELKSLSERHEELRARGGQRWLRSPLGPILHYDDYHHIIADLQKQILTAATGLDQLKRQSLEERRIFLEIVKAETSGIALELEAAETLWLDMQPLLAAERLTAPSLDVAPADEGSGKRQERLVDVGSALVTDREAAEAAEPRQRALHHPAVPAQALAAVDPASGDPSFDAAPA